MVGLVLVGLLMYVMGGSVNLVSFVVGFVFFVFNVYIVRCLG